MPVTQQPHTVPKLVSTPEVLEWGLAPRAAWGCPGEGGEWDTTPQSNTPSPFPWPLVVQPAALPHTLLLAPAAGAAALFGEEFSTNSI